MIGFSQQSPFWDWTRLPTPHYPFPKLLEQKYISYALHGLAPIPIAVDFCSSNSGLTTCTTAASYQISQACKMTARFPLQRPKMPSRPTMSRPRWKKPPQSPGLMATISHGSYTSDSLEVQDMFSIFSKVSRHPHGMEDNGPKLVDLLATSLGDHARKNSLASQGEGPLSVHLQKKCMQWTIPNLTF